MDQHECAQSPQQLCRRVNADLRIVYCYQCQVCGRKARDVRKDDVADEMTKQRIPPGKLPEWNPDLQDAYWQRQRELYQNEWQGKQEQERQEWRDRYNAHMQSDKWRRIRTKVLRRAAGVCEGCGERHPEHVHHKDYRRLGDEMLFDLVAVCSICHQKLHPNNVIEDTYVRF